MTGLFKIIAIFSFIALISCDKPTCQNTNTIFEKNLPESAVYQQELVKQLHLNRDKPVSYWFEGYIESGPQTYLIIDVVSDSLCAQAYMLVDKWDESLEGIHRTKGMSYRGAELRGLEYDVTKEGTFVIEKVESIID